MTKITGIERLDDTITPVLGMGDSWQMSWAADDDQYVGMCDGWEWNGMPEHEGKAYNSRIYRLEGHPPDYRFHSLPGYPDLENHFAVSGMWGRYYGFGIIALDNCIYQFLGSTNTPPLQSAQNGFAGVKLIYSDDRGKTWRNHDGSSPVRWEPWEERSRDNMLFWHEPNDVFSILSVLQMGKNYEWNEDGYVYLYAPNGNVDGLMNQLVLCRVPKDRILDRSAYEFYESMTGSGEARWTDDIGRRGVVCGFPKGWVSFKSIHPWGWVPSVIYNKPLNTYMMVTWGTGVRPDSGDWFEKPSYFGVWTAPKPWGPWTQVHEEEAWLPGGHPDTRAYLPQISPKWLAKDGKSFWLVWSDFRLGQPWPAAEDQTAENMKKSLPYYGFQCQNVLILGR